jgi:hypothetical protein
VDLDRLVDAAHEEPRDERRHRLPSRRISMADQQDVGAGLERREIAGPAETPGFVAVRVVVGLVERVLVGSER